MKLTITELRLLVRLKQYTEQGHISQALELFFSMKEVWDKLKAKELKKIEEFERTANLLKQYH
jgi:hypothetical protein